MSDFAKKESENVPFPTHPHTHTSTKTRARARSCAHTDREARANAPTHTGAPLCVRVLAQQRSMATPTLQTPGSTSTSNAPPRRRVAGGAPSSAATAISDDQSQNRNLGASGAPPQGPGRRGRALGNGGSGVPVRRSSRLSSAGVLTADARDLPPAALPRLASDGHDEGVQAALWLLRQLASGYRSLCLFKCQDAVLAFRALPHQQYNTGWVLNQARCHEL